MYAPAYRVIVADDQAEFRLWLRQLLGQSGMFQVVGEASDGEQAIDVARLLGPDVMIVDVEMPGMDGIEVARRVSSLFPQVRVIVISIHEEQEYERLAHEAGATAFIPKGSLSLDCLFRTLQGEG